MKHFSINTIVALTLSLFVSHAAGGAEHSRPIIQADASDKARVLLLIKKYDWAAECFNKMKTDAAPLIKAHQEDPAKALKDAPKFGKTGVHGHINWIEDAVQAGTLYFMTGKEDYAQFAADRLNHYVQFLGAQKGLEAVVSSDGQQRDYRDVHENIALCYDYIQPFLMKDGTTVFDLVSGKRIPFDHAKAQLMFSNIVEYGFKSCGGGSNITIMETDGILYPALCIEDKKQRDAYVKTCVEGWTKNSGLLWMKKILVENKGIWPESATYSGVGLSGPVYMFIVDRIYPQYKMFDGFEEALNGILKRRFFVYPNETEQVSFGDAHRNCHDFPRFETFTRIIRRTSFKAVAERFFGQLKADRETFGYKPNNLWTMDPLEEYQAKPAETQSVHLPYAGIIIQNNLRTSAPKLHGLMYYTGGANYTHSHQSGLDMELYGAGAVMGGVGSELAGVASRGSDIYLDYYRIYAGHNTVVINGKSVGSNKGWKGYYNGWMDPVKLQAAEPMPYTVAASKDFTFSSQILNDKVNKAEQQRIVSIVRTSDTSGYYLDLFRSRSKGKNAFHDYIYHNLGDGLTLTSNNGTALTLNPAKDRYQTSVETPKARRAIPFPGWKSFSNVATSALTADTILGTFNMELKANRHEKPDGALLGKRYMHVAMPGGSQREYTSCEAPPILEAAGGYDKKNARVLSIRQPGEAWDRPFVMAFEPSMNEKPTIQGVEIITDGGKVVGAKIVSKVGDVLVTDLIIAQDEDNSTYQNATAQLKFKGRFAIIRTRKGSSGNDLTLYIGSGQELSYQGHNLKAIDNKGCVNERMAQPLPTFTNK